MKRIILPFITICLLASLAAAQRLLQIAAPEHYTLSLTPDLGAQTFAGDETIEINVLKPTSQIVLNAVNIDFQNVTLRGGQDEQKATVNKNEQNQTATLSVDKPLQPGPAAIHILYRGLLNHDLRGFYLGKNEQGDAYAATQFESTDARKAFPSFDEPAYKATFDITVVAPKGMIAISNGKVVSDTPGPGDEKHTVHFATSPKMSSYLVAMIVGQFEYLEGSADGVPIRVYTTPGRTNLAGFALESAKYALHYYDNYFSIKYPYGKLDLVALPDFAAGAMENTGCITYRETLLLVDDHHASQAQRKRVFVVTAHEMAHQWFGDLVTMKWWDDVWLNEGFASWMENKPQQSWHPEWHAELDDVRETGRALDLDSLNDTHAIHQTADTPAEIDDLFDAISYQKGAAVLNMLENYLGPEDFRKGVNDYLQAHKWGNATSEDLWRSLARASNKPVDTIMPTFIIQAGVPMVSVKNECSGNSTAVTLDQQRYYFDRSKFQAANAGANPELWKIPVCMKSEAGGKTTCHLLANKKEDQFSLPGCSPWVMANAGAEGYYRSNYRAREEHTMAQVATTALTPAERMMLLADVWSSVRVGREPIGDYLGLAEGLRDERSPAVMRQLIERLQYISAYLTSQNDHWAYQLWVRRLLSPIAKDLGFISKPGESDDQKILRTYVLLALGREGRDPAFLAEAQNAARAALENPQSADPELTPIYFTVTARSGDVAFYNELLARIKDKRTPEEYDLYLKTLAEFSSPALLQRTLEYAISPDVRSQDAAHLVAGVLENRAVGAAAWKFVQEHWSQIARNGGPFANETLVRATGYFCETARANEVKEFFSTRHSLTLDRDLNQALEQINNCVDLKSRQETEVSAWLQAHDGAAENERARPEHGDLPTVRTPQP